MFDELNPAMLVIASMVTDVKASMLERTSVSTQPLNADPTKLLSARKSTRMFVSEMSIDATLSTMLATSTPAPTTTLPLSE